MSVLSEVVCVQCVVEVNRAHDGRKNSMEGEMALHYTALCMHVRPLFVKVEERV
jgi:hypothetical protein